MSNNKIPYARPASAAKKPYAYCMMSNPYTFWSSFPLIHNFRMGQVNLTQSSSATRFAVRRGKGLPNHVSPGRGRTPTRDSGDWPATSRL